MTDHERPVDPWSGGPARRDRFDIHQFPPNRYAALADFDPAPGSFGFVGQPSRSVGQSSAPDVRPSNDSTPGPMLPGMMLPGPMPRRPMAPEVIVSASDGRGGRRWVRVGVLVAAVLAAVVGGVAGYAALHHPEPAPSAVIPVISVPAVPLRIAADPTSPVKPGATPVTPSAGTSAVATRAATTPAPTRAPARPTTTLPGRASEPAEPAQPVGPVERVEPVEPEPTVTSPAGGFPLNATFAGDGREVRGGGVAGFTGTVRLDNTGRRAAGGWRVVVTIPGGNRVTSGDRVTVEQDGERVTFGPRPGGAVPAGGSVRFRFTVDGMLPAWPSGCTVNRHPCH